MALSLGLEPVVLSGLEGHGVSRNPCRPAPWGVQSGVRVTEEMQEMEGVGWPAPLSWDTWKEPKRGEKS